MVHPGAGHETGTLVNALIAHCGASLSGIGGVKRPGIVHRLDKDTSGLLVVAKNDAAHQSLSAQFADHGKTGEMRRGYLAFVWGVPNRRAARSMRRSTGIRMRGRRWRCAKAAATRSPIGRSSRASTDARRQAGRLAAGLRARDRPHPPDPGPSRSYRPPFDGGPGLWPALQDQGRPPRAREPGGPGGPRPPGATCIPPGLGAPPNRGDSASGTRICPEICDLLEPACKRRYDAGCLENRRYAKWL